MTRMQWLLCGVVLALTVGCAADACPLCDAADAGDVESVQRLLAATTDPAERAALADRAIYRLSSDYSPREHGPAIAALLFQAGANPHQDRVFRTTDRSRALVAEDLAQVGEPEMVRAFINAGFDVKGEPGAWVLLRASRASAKDVARVLMEAGADPTRRLLETTALDEARKAGDAEMVAILERRP
ncbi:MAG: ankyrin repeat domain-containing protein [Vicinamibacterales bacterium]